MRNSRCKPPKNANLSREARSWWVRITTEWILDDAGLLILASGLESFDRMREAQRLLADEGIVVKDRFGQDKMHPAALVETQAKMAMMRALKALNLDIEPLNSGPGRPGGR